jgi:hypothetical protein
MEESQGSTADAPPELVGAVRPLLLQICAPLDQLAEALGVGAVDPAVRSLSSRSFHPPLPSVFRTTSLKEMSSDLVTALLL